MNVHNSSQLGMKDVEHSRSIRTFMHNLKIKVMTKIEEVIKIIENNQINGLYLSVWYGFKMQAK